MDMFQRRHLFCQIVICCIDAGRMSVCVGIVEQLQVSIDWILCID